MESHRGAPNRWLVVSGAIIIQLALGALYAWSVFTARLTDLSGAYAFSASETAWVFSAGLATFAIVMVLAGRILPKIGPRPLAIAGGPVGGAVREPRRRRHAGELRVRKRARAARLVRPILSANRQIHRGARFGGEPGGWTTTGKLRQNDGHGCDSPSTTIFQRIALWVPTNECMTLLGRSSANCCSQGAWGSTSTSRCFARTCVKASYRSTRTSVPW